MSKRPSVTNKLSAPEGYKPEMRPIRGDMDDSVRAVVREIDGRLVLDDPDADDILRAIGKHNCKSTLTANADRVEHFRRRIRERGESPAEIVIVLINVDDPHGGPLADVLMPGHDWQQYRDRGETPYARGLTSRHAIAEVVSSFDRVVGDNLKSSAVDILVVDYGVAEAFTLSTAGSPA